MRARRLVTCLGFVAVHVSGCSDSGGGGRNLKIGVVTDLGSTDDQGFNQAAWEGAQAAAQSIGAPAPMVVVPKEASEYATAIKGFLDQGYDLVVTVGFTMTDVTVTAAHANPMIKFIGLDQSPCVTKTGEPDPTFACEGDAAALLPNYQALTFKEQQAGYLAGMVAAGISARHHIAAVGGIALVPPVVNFIIGYYNGARSVYPGINVDIAYVTDSDFGVAFNDTAKGKSFTDQLLSASPEIDVVFQVAGLTGIGVLQSACDHGIRAIGVDVDQYLSNPQTKSCTVTSAEKKLLKATSDAIKRVADHTARGGPITLDITTDSVGISPFHDSQSLITPALQQQIDTAIQGLKNGTQKACVETSLGTCDSLNGKPRT
jgi:basic membrane protein A